ncbi:hypothetical protein ACWCQK_33335 [Streptomyces sp. NPDC002306]
MFPGRRVDACGDAPYWAFLAAYAVCFTVTRTVYLRPRAGATPGI